MKEFLLLHSFNHVGIIVFTDMSKPKDLALPEEVVISKIHLIRGQKVMWDRDLAELYNVETRVLNQAIKRNPLRFPPDFMFQLSRKEFVNLISQNVTSNWGGVRKMPHAFTEQGVAMLSSVLNSESAILVNINIIRIFTKMSQMLLTNKDVLLKLERLEQKVILHEDDIKLIFGYLKELLNPKTEPMRKIGFKHKKDE
ncbi:MAG: ORF6N domain-containing protein [Chryseolinea sp.]